MSNGQRSRHGEPTSWRLGTNEEGTYSEVLGGALARFFDAYSDKLRVDPEITTGYTQNIRKIAAGELDAAFSHSETIKFAYEGSHQFEDDQPDPLPVFGFPVMQNIHHHFVHRRDSGIREIADLAGATVSIGFSPSFHLISEAVLDAEGVLGSVNLKTMKLNDQAAALRNGEIDAAIGAIINYSSNPATRQIWETMDAAVTRLSDGGANRLQTKYPWFGVGTLEADDPRLSDFIDVRERLTLPLLESLTVVRPDLDYDLVYRSMETLHREQTKLADLEESLRGFGFGTYRVKGQEFDRWGMGSLAANEIPFHPASADYLAEIGEWVHAWERA